MQSFNPKKHQRRSIRLKGYDYAQKGLYFITICTQNRQCLFGEINHDVLHVNDAGTMIIKWYLELENKFHDIKCGTYVVMPNHFHAIIHNIGVGADLRVRPNTKERVHPNIEEHIENDVKERVRPNTNKKNPILYKNMGFNTDKNNPIMGEHPISDKNNPMLGEHPISDKNNPIVGEHPISDKTNPIVGKHPISDKNNPIMGEHPISDKNNPMMGEHIGSPLHVVMQWFKTMTTNDYIRNVKNNNWQRFDGKLWQRNYWEHTIRNEKSHQNISEYIINNPAKWIADKLNPNNISTKTSN